MTYVKTFAIFESETESGFESVNEAMSKAIKANPELKTKLEDEIKKMSPEDMDALKADVTKLGAKLKLSANDMKNPEIVAKALLDAGMVKESFSYDGDIDNLNEGVKEWWEKSKMKVSKWMTKLGIGGLVSGLVSMAYGSTLMPNVDYMPHNATVTPNAWIIAGGTAMAISLIVTILGMKGQGILGDVASGAGSAVSGR
jgi:hypothetical protein